MTAMTLNKPYKHFVQVSYLSFVTTRYTAKKKKSQQKGHKPSLTEISMVTVFMGCPDRGGGVSIMGPDLTGFADTDNSGL